MQLEGKLGFGVFSNALFADSTKDTTVSFQAMVLQALENKQGDYQKLV